jgi:glycosyltransferase involved in cell wall biosynthesis
VLVPSEATAQECREAGFDPDILRVVPWGVTPPTVTDAEVAATAARYGLDDRPYVLFVGTVEPRKNLAGLTQAMALLAGRGVDLALVGPDGWNEDLAAHIDVLHSAGVRVHRLGFQPPDALPAIYAGAAAFCFPSLREGFGMPVLEAMACGAPVVTSAGTATAEVVGDAGLLIAPTAPADIALALERILDDPALAADLRARGRERAATFTWERTAALTAAAYAEVAP